MKGCRPAVAVATILIALAVGCRPDGAPPGAAADGATSGDSAPPSADAAAKRVGPPEVTPAIIDGMRVEAIHWGMERGLGQNGGYLAVVDEATNRELWVLQVYPIEYDPHLESDVQDIFIERVEVAGSSSRELDVTDERGRRFRVDIGSRSVRPLAGVE